MDGIAVTETGSARTVSNKTNVGTGFLDTGKLDLGEAGKIFGRTRDKLMVCLLQNGELEPSFVSSSGISFFSVDCGEEIGMVCLVKAPVEPNIIEAVREISEVTANYSQEAQKPCHVIIYAADPKYSPTFNSCRYQATDLLSALRIPDYKDMFCANSKGLWVLLANGSSELLTAMMPFENKFKYRPFSVIDLNESEFRNLEAPVNRAFIKILNFLNRNV